jgi:DNA-binding NarL/FixJ family response regulator
LTLTILTADKITNQPTDRHRQILRLHWLGERYGAMRSKETRPATSRTPRKFTLPERQILQLIWKGLKGRQIAERLQISLETVEMHRAAMMTKVRVKNTAALLRAAIKANMISID